MFCKAGFTTGAPEQKSSLRQTGLVGPEGTAMGAGPLRMGHDNNALI